MYFCKKWSLFWINNWTFRFSGQCYLQHFAGCDKSSVRSWRWHCWGQFSRNNEVLFEGRLIIKFTKWCHFQGSQLSWNCSEISNYLEILLIWSECPDMNLCYAVIMALHSFVECQVMFSYVSFYCFMCNSALVTFLGLQYWSASMNNIYDDRKTCIFFVLSLVKPTKMSRDCPEIL